MGQHRELHRQRKRVFRTVLNSRLFLFGLEPAASALDRFSASALTLSHLNDWFARPLELEYQNKQFDNCLVKFQPDRNSARAEFEGSGFQVTVDCSRQLPSVADSVGAKFTFSYSLIVEPDAPQSLAWHMGLATLLREFFMFLIGSGVYTLKFEVFAGNKPPEGEVHVFPTITVPMLVRLDPRYFYSQHAQVKPQFESLLAKWLEERERLTVIRHTLSNLLTVDGVSPEAVFMRVVQTMEHLHGLVKPQESRYVSRAVWKAFTDWLDKHFPECWASGGPAEHAELQAAKQPLIGRIKGVNSLSFRTRLRELFDAVPGREIMPLIDNPPDIAVYLDAFMAKVEATRNYLTHFSAEQRERAFPVEDLETPTLQCWAVLIFTLSRFLGLSDELAGDMALAARKTLFLVGSNTQL